MKEFNYRAINADGRMISGTQSAENEDDLAARQRRYGGAQLRVFRHAIKIDVVHEIEKMMRIGAVQRHQAGKRCAMLIKISLLDAMRFCFIRAK